MNFIASLLNLNPSACCQDPVSSFTHLVGAVWFACLAKPLLQKAEGRMGLRVGLGIYVFACIFLLAISGIYHWFPPGWEREFLRRMDLAAIFVLIAGTFTPICGMLYRGAVRWGSLSMIWTIALTGILLRAIFFDTFPESWGTGVFLGFGWLVGIFAFDLWRRHSFAFVKPVVYGGLAYTVGAVILEAAPSAAWPRGISPHDFWHLAVLLGIAFHWQFVSRIAGMPRPIAGEHEPAELAPAFTAAYDPVES